MLKHRDYIFHPRIRLDNTPVVQAKKEELRMMELLFIPLI